MTIPPSLILGSEIHLVGIGGAGMRAIALLLLELGFKVTGSDIDTERDLVRDIADKGAKVFSGNNPEHLQNPSLVVCSTAIKDDNPEVLEAKCRDIPVVNRTDIFLMLGFDKKLIAVAGTHGKTTTTAMITHIAKSTSLNPTFYFGSPAIGSDQAHWTNEPLMIMETDESDRSFLKFHADVAVITNIDRDHMEMYDYDLSKLIGAFEQFLLQSHAKSGYQVINADDKNILSIKLPDFKRAITFGWSDLSHVKAGVARYFVEKGFLCSETHVSFMSNTLGILKLNVPGKHNIYDALAAIASATRIGINPREALEKLATFQGTQRRLELMGIVDRHPVYDDYAHHPTAIQAGILALRKYYPGKPLCLVIQPFRLTRTSYLPNEYIDCVRGADRVLITEIFPAEIDNDVKSRQVYGMIKSGNPDMDITYVGALNNVSIAVSKSIKHEEVIYMAGPYPIRSTAKTILEALS